jgi:hypothetical protein
MRLMGRSFCPDLAGAIALAGIAPMLESRPLQDAIRAPISTPRTGNANGGFFVGIATFSVFSLT